MSLGAQNNATASDQYHHEIGTFREIVVTHTDPQADTYRPVTQS